MSHPHVGRIKLNPVRGHPHRQLCLFCLIQQIRASAYTNLW
jgi:hypothetical protein